MTVSSPVLVTGSAGFIGFHTSKTLLDQGRAVVGVDNLNNYYSVALKEARLDILKSYPNYTFHKADVSDKSGMEAIWNGYPDIQHIIHLAAQAGVRHSLKDPYTYVQSNVMGHLVMLELARHRSGFRHLVYASSSSVYGSNTKMPFSIEDRTDTPISIYAATKKADELMSYAYAHLFQIPSTGLRFFTVYGPWGRPDMSALIFAKAILEDKPITVFNNGQMRRDYTYVEDIVAGILQSLETPPVDGHHQVFNLGNNTSEKLMRFISLIEEHLDKKAEINFQPMQPGDVPETYADIQASKDRLGFDPKVPIEVGIPKFVEWFKNNSHLF